MKKKLLSLLFALILMISTAIPAYAATLPRLVDDGDILTDKEEERLTESLDKISEKHEVEVVVISVRSLGGEDITEFADDVYDYYEYGYGDSYDGVLLLVSMDDREWAISTCGFGETAFTDAGIDYIGDKITPELEDGEYSTAFSTFAELCDDFIGKAKKGDPYDLGNLPKEPFNVLISLLVSLVIGVVAAFIATAVMKGQLRSVRFQPAANSYIKANSMVVTQSRDLFLYTHISRREKPKPQSGGSSTHTSSLGRRHGGGRGKF